ncbi:MAG: hypothetical protein ACK41T_02615 [Pseudobdellovibrio sp.]
MSDKLSEGALIKIDQLHRETEELIYIYDRLLKLVGYSEVYYDLLMIKSNHEYNLNYLKKILLAEESKNNFNASIEVHLLKQTSSSVNDLQKLIPEAIKVEKNNLVDIQSLFVFIEKTEVISSLADMVKNSIKSIEYLTKLKRLL